MTARTVRCGDGISRINPLWWASYVAVTDGTLVFRADTPEVYRRRITAQYLGSLLRAIAQHARYPDDGRGEPFAFPAVGTLAEVCRSTTHWVRRGLRELERQGLISTAYGGGWAHKGVGRTSTYTLHLDAHPVPPRGRQRGAATPVQSHPVDPRPTPVHAQVATPVHAQAQLEGVELGSGSLEGPLTSADGRATATDHAGRPAPRDCTTGAARGADSHPPPGPPRPARPGSAEAAARAHTPAAPLGSVSGPDLVRQALADAARRAAAAGLTPGPNRADRRRAARRDRT